MSAVVVTTASVLGKFYAELIAGGIDEKTVSEIVKGAARDEIEANGLVVSEVAA